MDNAKLHVAIVSSPGMGHVIPVLVLGNRLATVHGVRVTILVITTSNSDEERRFLKTLTLSTLVRVIALPPVDISAKITPATAAVTQLCMSVREALPIIRSSIASMNCGPDALILDLFCPSAIPIAREFSLPVYVYAPTNAWSTTLFMYIQVLDKEIEGRYVEQKEPLRIPGCKSVRPEDVVDPMLDRNDQQYHDYIELGIGLTRSDGILVNTWADLEPTTLKALRENETLKPAVKVSVYPVGPLTRPVEPSSLKSKVLEWLDEQPVDSVIYVSFGSGGVLSADQIKELAFGLELSQQRFIWVVRLPLDGGLSKSDDPLDYLPGGFLNRTKNVGFVVPLWAQQVEILGHPSVGGFLSHCGWNSTLESISAGVPMIAWPLYAEQKLNAAMLTEDLGVAVRPEVLPTKKMVEREEVEKMVRMVMQQKEGQEMRQKMKQLKSSADDGLSNRGSSFISMYNVLDEIRLNFRNQNH
ncbi:unnamed protein product [Coffea canephora]|uniref:Glycosyltransferase n=1 Tax=Coffea canephora TaxID=49390 RepID=A0A068U2T4_COFCA|nr:unnamed protein product [Coffea canephora]